MKKFIVTEKRVIGVFEDREEAWEHLDLMKQERPDSEICWHAEDEEQLK